MRRHFLILISVCLLSCYFPVLLAHQAYVSLAVGLAKFDIPSAITIRNGSFYTNGMANDRYDTHQATKTTASLTTGLIFPHQSSWISQVWLGLSFQHFAKQDMGGNISQYALDQFKNYQYQWYRQVNTLMLVSRAVLPLTHHVDSFAQLGIGAATINMTGYQEQAANGIASRISPAFTDHHHLKATYAAQAGLQKSISDTMQISLAYQYQYFGRLNSGQGSGLWSQSLLSLKNVNAHMAMIGLTWHASNSA